MKYLEKVPNVLNLLLYARKINGKINAEYKKSIVKLFYYKSLKFLDDL